MNRVRWLEESSNGAEVAVMVVITVYWYWCSTLSESSSSTSDHPEILVRAAARMNDVNTLASTERIH